MDLTEVMMRHKGTIFTGVAIAMLIGVAACNSQQRSSRTTTHPNAASQKHAVDVTWSSTTKVDVKDPGYGMTAFTFDVPVGWKFVGTILRPSGCHAPAVPAAGLSDTVLSPDGITAIEKLPGVTWSWTSDGTNILGPKCPSNVNIVTADAFLLNIAIPNLRPDATVVKVLPNPQSVLDAIAKNNEQGEAQLQSHGLRGKVINDFGRVRITYVRNGQPVEEIVSAVIHCTEIPVLRPMRGFHTQRNCSTPGTFVTRAPKGSLDAVKQLAPPAINPEWDNRVSQDMGAAFRQAQAASDRQFQSNMAIARRQTEQIVQNGQQFDRQLKASTDASMQADAARQHAIDDSAHQTALHSLDRQTFINPNTGQKIEASSEYNHQWISSDGSTLIQNQDPSFDPNGTVYPISQSWTELVPQ
ncbi:MAG: hypothetical protein WB439_02310 [Acidobacteriaceae bacterium]